MSGLGASARIGQLPEPCSALIGTADPVVAQRLPWEIERLGRKAPAIASSFAHLRQRFIREEPSTIVVDGLLLRDAPLAASLRQFELAHPVILLAPPSRQREAAPLVAEGAVEFVLREGDFLALAASLIERRLRTAPRLPRFSAPLLSEWGDIGELFRHEINNPLTGILGNSEMLLAHREHLTVADTERLETVVDLAVRLRETIRRLSTMLQPPAQSLKQT